MDKQVTVLEEVKKTYNPIINYLKALGIILMVFGHSESAIPHAMSFVQMFHMPLFFIASGYCFKEKYILAPKSYVYNKVRGIWWPYVKWSLLFLLLHNVFFSLNLYNGEYGWRGSVSHLYTLSEFMGLVYTILIKMKGHEQLLGGYWFMNALFFGSLIAWIMIRYVKSPIIGGCALLIVCTVLNKTCLHLPVFGISSQAFAAAFLILIGYSLSKYKIKPFTYWQICVALVLTLLGSFLWNMPMNQDSYSNKYFALYIVTASLASWSFYSLFDKMKSSQGVCVKALDFIGKNTLTILTWHFLAFKLVSLLIIGIYDLPTERLAEFPVIKEYSEQGWWIAYFSVAIIVTCGIANCNKWIKNSWLKL